MQKYNVPDSPFLSHSEQLKGKMALKVSEENLEESKIFSRKVEEYSMEALSSLNKGLIDLDGSNVSKSMGKIDIEMKQQNSRKRKEKNLEDIQ
jgi:hypothetical protein